MPVRSMLVVVIGLTLGAHTQAAAQRRLTGSALSAGLRSGRDFENHAWSLGGQLGLRLGDRFELRPSGDWFFGDQSPFRWQLNGDGIVTFGPGRSVYGGGGVAFTKVRPLDAIKTGYNLFFGLNLAPPGSRSSPFAEARWTFINDTSPFRVVVGVNYRLGR